MPAQELASFLIGPQTPSGNTYYDQTQIERGKYFGRNFPSTPPTGEAVNVYTDNHYYDLGLTLYIDYARTKDPEFLSLFEKVCDSWWKLPGWIDEGRQRNFDATSPKFSGICGLILRATDRPEMWDWLYECTNYYHSIWIRRRMDDPNSDFQLREAAFTLQFMAWLAKALPDSYPLTSGTATDGATKRTQMLKDCETAVLNYFGSPTHPHGQKSDGSWRWDDWYYRDPVDGSQLRGITQPFMIGLLLDALIDVHAVTANQTVKSKVLELVTKSCRHLYSGGPYTKQHLNTLNVNCRGFHYFYHGGTTLNPTRYEKGDLPPDWNPPYPSDVQNQRQPIGLLVAAYGWSYDRTGDTYFKQAGDELWDSAYGETDGIKNYFRGDKGKDYNQNTRSASSYLAWTNTTPIEPIPPTKTESPNGTKGTLIVDSNLATWTIGAKSETLRDSIQVGGGQGTEYKYVDKVVYVLGDISSQVRNWYQWVGSSWAGVGPIEPGIPAPTPIPPVPTPTPPIVTTRTAPWPKQVGKQNVLIALHWKDRFRLRETDGTTATFEKVS